MRIGSACAGDVLALNEGRDRSPGDTCDAIYPTSALRCSLNEGRDRSPGDTWERHRTRATPARPLNEGRDRSPGDTGPYLPVHHVVAVRSTKAGTVVPATPVPSVTSLPDVVRLADGRRQRPLNEGRDRSPGDTTGEIVEDVVGQWAPAIVRSTKAGTVVPATRPGQRRIRPHPHAPRSTKAGTVVPATQHRGAQTGVDTAMQVAQRRPGP